MDVFLYYNGVEIDSGNVDYTRRTNDSFWIVDFIDSDGWRWRGNVKAGFASGTFRSPNGVVAGKWQLNKP